MERIYGLAERNFIRKRSDGRQLKVIICLLGAYINKRLNLNLAGAAKMCFIAACIGLGCTCLLYIKCDTLQIAGVNTRYLNRLVYLVQLRALEVADAI